jgi:type II secretory pathway pseudopilin PulG
VALARGGRPAAGGFTLLETLIAVFVLGLILSAVLGSYRVVTGTTADLESKIALEQEGRFFVQRLARQIRCCYGGPADQVRRSAPDVKSARPAAATDEPTPLFRGGPAVFDDAVLQFVTTSSSLNRNSVAGSLTLVAYKVDKGRGAWLVCEDLYGRRRTKEEDREWREVLTDLQEIELRFFNGVDWLTEWDSNVAGGLPKAVRIKLVLQSDRDGRPRCFTALAPIRCGAPRKLEAEVSTAPTAEKKQEKK